MSIKQNCSACEDLRESSPEFVLYGISDENCASLQNDTGLTPSSGHNDCQDLNNMNDCLIGDMENEVDAYNSCDWKKFAKAFISNLWTMLKGIICAICGIWTNIHRLASQILALCELVNASIAPSAPIYGIFPRSTPGRGQYIATMGSIPNKNGRPALIDAQGDSHNNDVYTGVGLRWGEVKGINCTTGAIITRHFWKPYIWGMKINKDVELHEALWVVTKSQLQSLIPSFSDALWEAYTVESWVWSQHRIAAGSDRGKNIWLRLHVGDAGYSNNYLVLTFNGTSYPNEEFDYDALIQEGDTNEVRWG